ncbi:Secreted RxLR effector peptide protein [Phytophthora palmivora]|uniref:Secreted RxLR effector peptide protein n=1 Tax=Phytophthora palmivora TaxID=4796 RepID=A0A2P4YF45_9STRA|nr:Secreted RxLR effector peptide protein [Phytophthora palmivora]
MARLNQVSGATDNHLVPVFKFADEAKMKPDDLVTELKTIPEVNEKMKKKTFGMYTSYLKRLGKEV